MLTQRPHSVPVTSGRDHFRLPHVPLAVVRIKRQNEIRPHQHEFHELVVILHGQGQHITGTREYRIGAGDVFLIKPGLAHGYRATADLELVNILYRPRELKLPEVDVADLPGYHAVFELEPAMRARHGFQSRLRLTLEQLGPAQRFIALMEEELHGRAPGAGYLAAAHFMQLVGLIARSYAGHGPGPASMVLRLGEVVSHIDRHFDGDLGLDVLAEMAHMSRSTLHRAFCRALGASPGAYVLKVRIAKAAALLVDPAARITEVAFKAGFTDSNYFARQFKKMTGAAPRAYREKLRG
jgi:AraC family L-rhamnose operon transcriptional activator RhaR/AraC family L-rhamnose operon regulatory protein RhaS